MSERQSDYLAELRNKQPSGDEDSLHYDNTGQAKNEEADESNGDEVYDDTNEDLYEVVGAAQSPASNQQPQSPIQDVDYEISAAAFPSTPASAPGSYSWLFTILIPHPHPTATAVKASKILPEHCHTDDVAIFICPASFSCSGKLRTRERDCE